MREIKFRAWDEMNKTMHFDFQFIKSGEDGNNWILFVSNRQPISDYEGWRQNPYFRQQFKIMQFIGRQDRDKKDIYDRDLLQIELPEIINEGQNGGIYEPSWPSVIVSPEKIIIAEVRISKYGNVSAIVRKISFPNQDWTEDIPNIDVDDEMNIKRNGIIP